MDAERMSGSTVKGDPLNLHCRLVCLDLYGCRAANSLFSAPAYSPFSLHPQTPEDRGGPSGNYLASQDLSSDSAADECLHILTCLLLLHRCGGVEGYLHHGESSGCAVRRGSNQYLGLQVGRGEDRACLSSTYCLPVSHRQQAASSGLGLLMTQSQAGWESVGGAREVLREEREGARALQWKRVGVGSC